MAVNIDFRYKSLQLARLALRSIAGRWQAGLRNLWIKNGTPYNGKPGFQYRWLRARSNAFLLRAAPVPNRVEEMLGPPFPL